MNIYKFLQDTPYRVYQSVYIDYETDCCFPHGREICTLAQSVPRPKGHGVINHTQSTYGVPAL